MALDAPPINEHPASQHRKAGETAAFNVAAAGPPGTGLNHDEWRDGELIHQDPAAWITGLWSATRRVESIFSRDAGKYSVTVRNDRGQTDGLAAILTLDLNSHIFTIENTTRLIQIDPRVVLEQADAVDGPGTTVPRATSRFSPAVLGWAKFFRRRPGP